MVFPLLLIEVDIIVVECRMAENGLARKGESKKNDERDEKRSKKTKTLQLEGLSFGSPPVTTSEFYKR